MYSLILQVSVRYLRVLLLGFSVYLLLRGHNHPGGGFIGGLMAASAFLLVAMTGGVRDAKRALKLPPQVYVGMGLLFALASGILALMKGNEFLKSIWWQEDLPGIGHLSVGSPLLFDFGVYLVVIGVTVTLIFALMEEPVQE